MKETDIIIIGAGPCGLFTVFEAGLLKLRCHLIDSLAQVGGQLTEIYPKKPIYDIPGFPEVKAGDLVENLMKQIAPFKPEFTLGERAEKIEKADDGSFIVTTSRNSQIKGKVIAIAGGLGCFEPRKPPIANIAEFEDKGVEYIIKDPDKFRGKKVVISGGGDSALDWSIILHDVVERMSLVHRNNTFRGHLDSVDKIQKLADDNLVDLVLESEVVGLQGNNKLEAVIIKNRSGKEIVQEADYFIPLFGLTPKLGPIADWGLNVSKDSITVNTVDYSTNVDGIYAIGDINTYEGKLKLILCGFHEATIMVQSAFKRIYPDKKLSFKYTTVLGGIDGF
jgi:thioredoxin reductase (NADPH)